MHIQKEAVFHSHENIKSCVFTAVKILVVWNWMSSALSVDFLAHFRISNACNFLISGQKHNVWVFIILYRKEYLGN